MAHASAVAKVPETQPTESRVDPLLGLLVAKSAQPLKKGRFSVRKQKQLERPFLCFHAHPTVGHNLPGGKMEYEVAALRLMTCSLIRASARMADFAKRLPECRKRASVDPVGLDAVAHFLAFRSRFVRSYGEA